MIRKRVLAFFSSHSYDHKKTATVVLRDDTKRIPHLLATNGIRSKIANPTSMTPVNGNSVGSRSSFSQVDGVRAPRVLRDGLEWGISGTDYFHTEKPIERKFFTVWLEWAILVTVWKIYVQKSRQQLRHQCVGPRTPSPHRHLHFVVLSQYLALYVNPN